MTIFPAFILAIDSGGKAGAALYHRDVLIESWTVKPGGEGAIVAEASARAAGEPLVVVAEKWVAHGAFGGGRTMGGLGRHWGRWESVILAAGIAKSHVVRVVPQRWQAATIAYRVGQNRDQRLALVEQCAQFVKPGVVRDEAAAILIGRWATRAPEVLAALSIAESKRLGVDARTARSVVANEKIAKRIRRQKRAAAAPRKAA